MNKFKSSILIVTAVVALTSTNAFASPIPLGGGGVVVYSNQTGDLLAVTSSSPCIAFSGASLCTGAASTPFLVSGQDPIFAIGATGTIKDIGTAFPITAFESVSTTISGGPAIFDLIGILAPQGYTGCTPSSTVQCSTGTFLFSTLPGNQVQIGLALDEHGYLGTNATFTPYVGNFQTTLSGDLAFYTSGGCTGAVTIGSILACEGAGKTIRSTWSGSQSPVAVSSIPEPASLSMMGLGLLGLGLISRRRKQS